MRRSRQRVHLEPASFRRHPLAVEHLSRNAGRFVPAVAPHRCSGRKTAAVENPIRFDLHR
jgi:hypothetical protein